MERVSPNSNAVLSTNAPLTCNIPASGPKASSETTLVLGGGGGEGEGASSFSFSELLFPLTKIGASSDALLILKNGRQASLRWRLTAFAPPYLKTELKQQQKQQPLQQLEDGRGVFRILVSSGILKPDGEARVSVLKHKGWRVLDVKKN